MSTGAALSTGSAASAAPPSPAGVAGVDISAAAFIGPGLSAVQLASAMASRSDRDFMLIFFDSVHRRSSRAGAQAERMPLHFVRRAAHFLVDQRAGLCFLAPWRDWYNLIRYEAPRRRWSTRTISPRCLPRRLIKLRCGPSPSGRLFSALLRGQGGPGLRFRLSRSLATSSALLKPGARGFYGLRHRAGVCIPANVSLARGWNRKDSERGCVAPVRKNHTPGADRS